MGFLAAYIMQGRMQAIIVASVLAMLSLIFPPISIISASAVALVTLRNGRYAGAWIILGAGIAVALLGGLLFGGFFFAVAYALGFWLPVWLIAIVLRESGRLNVAFEVILILGFLAIGAFYLFGADPAEFWQQRLQSIIQQLVDNPDIRMQSDKIELGLSIASQYMTGILITGAVSSVVLSLLVARWWQANLYNPGGFGQEFLSLNPRSFFAYISLAVFLFAIFGDGRISEMARNMGVLAFFLYLVVGIAVLHVLVSATKSKRLLLPALYVIVLLIPHAMLPVALVGLTDAWQNWRGRVIANGTV